MRRPPTLAEAVLDDLRQRLIEFRLKPGDSVRVDQVASELGISPLPVREALRTLMAEGAVEYSPHRGFRVTELTLRDIEEMFLVCHLLEGEALRRGVPRLTDTDCDRMHTLLARLERRPEPARLWETVAIHQGFHFLAIEPCGLPRLIAQLRKLWDHTDHYRSLYLFADEVTHRAMQAEHREIAEACASRDAERVIGLMNTHRTHALAHVAHGFSQEPSAERMEA